MYRRRLMGAAVFFLMATVVLSALAGLAQDVGTAKTVDTPQTGGASQSLVPELTVAPSQMGPTKQKERPQTARQALLEMLLARTPEAFEKHLPSATREFVKTDLGIMPLQGVIGFLGDLQQTGRKVESFDTGATLIRMRDSGNEQAIELSVDDEIDGGDQVDLRLVAHIYRAGRAMPLPFVPTFDCRMMMEEGVWRLSEVALNLRLPLGDAGWLDEVKQRVEKGTAQTHEMLVLRRMRMLLATELTYAGAYPMVGFTCTLSDLAGSDAGHPGPRAAMLIDDEMASPLSDDYLFALSGCSGGPVKHFKLAAAPQNPENGERAFCSDESGEFRYADDGRAASCLAEGERLP
jgi:hypothetical protein